MSATEEFVTDVIDAVLRDVFQGKWDHLREQMLYVGRKASRKWNDAWINAHIADAWDQGYSAGFDDCSYGERRTSEREYHENPHRSGD